MYELIMRGGISQTINEFFQSIGIDLPSWAGVVIIILILMCFFPVFVKNARTQKARLLWKSSFYEPKEKRENLQQEALQLVENNPSGVFSLIELAIHNGHLQIAEETLRDIPVSKKNRKEIRRLQFRIQQKEARSKR